MECSDIFKCLFNIGNNELEIYKKMIDEEYRVDELGKIIGKDRSTVQRILQKLIECGIVKRYRKTIKEGGGYYYVYKSLSPEELKNWINKCIEKWYSEMKEAVKNFEEFI
ncbi:MAG TPA: ArsR family transcriptional regulator [Thermoplasmatales archaeon]|nr:ArsR family transcriptional regulator [Thermoplasmatales archaeon]